MESPRAIARPNANGLILGAINCHSQHLVQHTFVYNRAYQIRFTRSVGVPFERSCSLCWHSLSQKVVPDKPGMQQETWADSEIATVGDPQYPLFGRKASHAVCLIVSSSKACQALKHRRTGRRQ